MEKEELLNYKPMRRGEYLGKASDTEYYVALDKDHVFSLTIGAFYVWSLCDGNETVKDIIEKMSKETGIDYKELEQPVIDLVNKFLELGLVA